ncbi:hypothetical protein NPIL_260121, partial [Nephila pilipes]
MPHSAVVEYNTDTTRIRSVYDASSKEVDERSLNSCLMSGPHLNPQNIRYNIAILRTR